MNVTLNVNGKDLSPVLSTFPVRKETTSQMTVTTMDGVEHVGGFMTRDVITFTLWPLSGAKATEYYNALTRPRMSATYTTPYAITTRTQQVRLASDIDSAFGLDSIDGNRYYKGEEIVLRAVRCD